MITDEEMAELPADLELAFVEAERILRKRVQERESQARNNDYDPDPDRLEYMTRVLAAARSCKIEALAGLKAPRVSRNDIWEEYSQFKMDVDFVTTQIRLQSAQLNWEGSIALDPTSKRKIHHIIQQIREEIEKSDLSVEKKDALFAALNRFAKEVDRTRTRMQTAMALWMSFATAVGDGFGKLKSAREMLDSIARVMGKAKELEEHYTPKLPGSGERKRIEPPPQQLPEAPRDIDDDIPF